eukprot:434166-Amphidinium_carterae.2
MELYHDPRRIPPYTTSITQKRKLHGLLAATVSALLGMLLEWHSCLSFHGCLMVYRVQKQFNSALLSVVQTMLHGLLATLGCKASCCSQLVADIGILSCSPGRSRVMLVLLSLYLHSVLH